MRRAPGALSAPPAGAAARLRAREWRCTAPCAVRSGACFCGARGGTAGPRSRTLPVWPFGTHRWSWYYSPSAYTVAPLRCQLPAFGAAGDVSKRNFLTIGGRRAAFGFAAAQEHHALRCNFQRANHFAGIAGISAWLDCAHDLYQTAFVQVLVARFGLFAPDGHTMPDSLILVQIGSHVEVADRLAVGRILEFGIAPQMAGDDDLLVAHWFNSSFCLLGESERKSICCCCALINRVVAFSKYSVTVPVLPSRFLTKITSA